MKIEIANPRLGGAKYTSIHRATNFVQRGIAIWLSDARIRFVEREDVTRRAAEVRQTLFEESREFATNRGERVYWNGARNHKGACYPPGCNVLFPKTGTLSAARRYV